MENKEAKKEQINLRTLDDVDCANVVVSRQIKKLVRKVPSLSKSAIDCYVHGAHYIGFEFNGNKFIWHGAVTDKRIGEKKLTSDNINMILDKDELNKLLVNTYRSMCEVTDSVDLIDSPEDLLAFAETKLQEMLA